MMSKGTLYLSGPMSGYPHLNRAAFARAAQRFRLLGWKVVSPPERDEKTFGSLPNLAVGSPAYRAVIKRDLKDLLGCEAIHLLRGWERSRGASYEAMTAKECGIPFVNRSGKQVDPPRSHAESILLEAERLVNGPRRRDYNHPFFNFSRTAKLISAALEDKLKADLTPEDVGIIMILVKIARETHRHTRDCIVDIAGYAATIDLVHQKRNELEGFHGRIAE